MHRSTIFRRSIFLAILIAATILPMFASPSQAHADLNNTRADAWGTLEVAGTNSNNLGGSGVNIYSNGPQVAYTPDKPNNTVNGVVSGEEWQCVELVNRLYLTKGWITQTWTGNGGDLYTTASSVGLTNEQLNGSITSLSPGDVLVLQDSGSGHAAIINTYNSATGAIQIESQNTGQVFDSTFSLSNKTISSTGWGTYMVKGVVHHPASTTSPSIPTTTLTQNGDFTSGYASWTASPGTNLAIYNSSQLGPQSYYASYSGLRYASTNASTPSGFYQDITLPANSSAGQTFCVTAEIRTSGGGSGGSGALALFQLGGASTEGEGTNFGSLGSTWQPIEACDTATTAHTTLRVEFYPTVNGPMLDIDNVDVHLASDANGDFLNGYNSWTVSPGTNLAIYGNNQLGPQAYFASYAGTLGTNFASTNASSSSGFYQDIPINTTAGQTYCVTAQVRTSGGSSGGSGALALCELKQ